MKKIKNLLAVVMSIVFVFSFVVPISAATVPDNVNKSDAKIDDELKNIINKASSNEKIPVVLWLSDVDSEERNDQFTSKVRAAEIKGDLSSSLQHSTGINVLKNTTLTTEELSEQAQTLVEIKREVEKELLNENNANAISALESSYNIDASPIFVSAYAPLVIMEMTKDEISYASRNQSIETIYYYESIEPSGELIESSNEESLLDDKSTVATLSVNAETYPYGVWQEITGINTLKNELGLTGSGIKIGLLGNGVPDFEYAGINPVESSWLYEQFDYHLDNDLLHFPETQFNGNYADHANYVLSIISGFADDYEGVAPLAEIYCDGFNGYGWQYFLAVENLIDSGVNIISASINWGTYGAYNYVSKYVDYVTSTDDVLFCVSAGNKAKNEPIDELLSSQLSYNTITVGNINDNNSVDKSDCVRSTSSRYSGATNGVYKPDICAPGDRVSTYVKRNKTNGGTSAACPVVAGVCALLMEAYPVLQTKPLLIKSLLMSSACELDRMTDIYSSENSVEPALTRECGAGMVDVYTAYNTYDSGFYRYSEGGYRDEYNYVININQTVINEDKDIYICHNWEQWNTVNGESWTEETNYNELSSFHFTLSLYDPEGVLVAVSDYQYDRKQFIRYNPTITGNYTVRLIRSQVGVPAYYPRFALAYCIK